ncbi:MAG: hypothetical protein ACTSUK_07210 [Promethearchaeota archaeon]
MASDSEQVIQTQIVTESLMREIFKQLKQGFSKQEISETLNVSLQDVEKIAGQSEQVRLNAKEFKARNERIIQMMRDNKDDLELGKKRSKKRSALFERIANLFFIDKRRVYDLFAKEETQQTLQDTTEFSENSLQQAPLEDSQLYKQYLYYLAKKGVKPTTIEKAKSAISGIYLRYENEQGKKNIPPERWTQEMLDKVERRMKAGYFTDLRTGKKRPLGVYKFHNVLHNWGKTAQILKDAKTGKYIDYDVSVGRLQKQRKIDLGIGKYVPPTEEELVKCIDFIPQVFGLTQSEIRYVEKIVEDNLNEIFTQEDLEDVFIKEAIKRSKVNVSLRDYKDFQEFKRNKNELIKRFSLFGKDEREIKFTFNKITEEFQKIAWKRRGAYFTGFYVDTVKALSYELALRVCATHGLRHGNKKREIIILDDIKGFDRDRGLKGLKFKNIHEDEKETWFNCSDKYHEREHDVFMPPTLECYNRLIKLLPSDKKMAESYIFSEVKDLGKFLYELTEISGLGEFLRDEDGKIIRNELGIQPLMKWGKYLWVHGLRKWFATTAFNEWEWSVDEIAEQGYWTSREVLINDYIYGYKDKVRARLKKKIAERYASGSRRI